VLSKTAYVGAQPFNYDIQFCGAQIFDELIAALSLISAEN
jgi:hypothetical protein